MGIDAEEALYTFYANQRLDSKKKRETNYENSLGRLKSAGVEFTVNPNNQWHVFIPLVGRVIDYWPSTGLWKVRHTAIKDRGVQKLINFVRQRIQND